MHLFIYWFELFAWLIRTLVCRYLLEFLPSGLGVYMQVWLQTQVESPCLVSQGADELLPTESAPLHILRDSSCFPIAGCSINSAFARTLAAVKSISLWFCICISLMISNVFISCLCIFREMSIKVLCLFLNWCLFIDIIIILITIIIEL